MASQQLRKALFVDWYLAGFKRRDLGDIDVHARDNMTKFRETNGGDQSNVTRAYDRNRYGSVCSKLDIHVSPFVRRK